MRVLIVDDHELIQNALRLTVRQVDARCEVVSAKDLAAASALLDGKPAFDLVLLDLRLPDTEGLGGLVALRTRYPSVPVVVISAETKPSYVLQAINLGAMGFVPKTTPGDTIVTALRQVISGGVYVPAEILRNSSLMAGGVSTVTRDSRTGVSASEIRRSRLQEGAPNFGLTARQLDVLRLLLRGLPTKLISSELDLGEATVKTHLKSVFAALGVHNRTQAVLVASELGIQYKLDGKRA